MTILYPFIFRASLVPVFSFGETEIFEQLPNPKGSMTRTIQDKLQEWFQIAPVVFHGRGIFQYTFGWLPRRRAITTVGMFRNLLIFFAITQIQIAMPVLIAIF